jgi:hypothetical protein
METPVAVLPPVTPPPAKPVTPEPALPPNDITAEFYMGQVAAVLSMARTSRLNYRAAVKQIESIVQKYEGK